VVGPHVRGYNHAMPICITAGALDTIRTEAHRCHPCEACGLLLGQGDAIATAWPAANVAPQPERHFEIDPTALIAAHRAARAGRRFWAIFIRTRPAPPTLRRPMPPWPRATGGSGPLSPTTPSRYGMIAYPVSNRFPMTWLPVKA